MTQGQVSASSDQNLTTGWFKDLLLEDLVVAFQKLFPFGPLYGFQEHFQILIRFSSCIFKVFLARNRGMVLWHILAVSPPWICQMVPSKKHFCLSLHNPLAMAQL